MRHLFTITAPPEKTPSKKMPDGAITGNGDISVVWGGTSDRVQLYIGKCDFWKASPKASTGGGTVPLGIIEISLPYTPYSNYSVEQDMDNAVLTGRFAENGLDIIISVTTCATENTILIEMDSAYPGLSTHIDLENLIGNDAICENFQMGDIQYITRSFEGEELYFTTSGIAALRYISRVRENGREKSRWSVHICTNHDSAAYRNQAISAAEAMDNINFFALKEAHADWWKRFWSASSLTLEDKVLENHWYMDMYIMACSARNKKFPPGLWGNFSTSDGMDWFGDYHLNYNHQSPFVALCGANHTELLDCYDAPLFDFLPRARQFSKKLLGCRGVYFPVSIGPLGMETDLHLSKEHGHVFLGQKSHAVYCAVIMAMRWYSTYDIEYATNKALPFFLEIASFWEDYLIENNGKYEIINDALFEIAWWRGLDYMPQRHTAKNPISSVGFVRMFMKCLVDMCTTLRVHLDKVSKWDKIAKNLGPAKVAPITEETFVTRSVEENRVIRDLEPKGKKVLLGEDDSPILEPFILQYVYPAGEASPLYQPEIFEAAKNTIELLDCWLAMDMPYIVCPSAARLGIPPKKIIKEIKTIIEKLQLPNGVINFSGGGIENSAIIPATLQEMMLQSYENIIRFFPNWDLDMSANFTGWRTFGAFVVDANLKDGVFEANILSEKGKPLSIIVPEDGYVLCGENKCIPLSKNVTTIETFAGEVFTIRKGK